MCEQLTKRGWGIRSEIDLKGKNGSARTGLIWLWTGTSGGFTPVKIRFP
jgi:hypothetical protein